MGIAQFFRVSRFGPPFNRFGSDRVHEELESSQRHGALHHPLLVVSACVNNASITTRGEAANFSPARGTFSPPVAAKQAVKYILGHWVNVPEQSKPARCF